MSTIIVRCEPSVSNEWRLATLAAAKRQMRPENHSGPIDLKIVFALARPKSHYKAGKRSGELRRRAPIYPVEKPDTDSLTKYTIDLLTEAGAWRRASRIVSIYAIKTYSDSGEPFSLIHIGKFKEGEP